MSRLAAVMCVLLGYVGLAAFEATLDRRALEEAIAIGQSRIESIRTRFQTPYRVSVNRAPVDYVEVVTPFRAVVLATELHARAGDRSFGLRDAQEMTAAPAELATHVELTFHPHNTFIGVPDYTVVLRPVLRGDTVQPRTLDRIPRFGPRVDGVPLQTEPTPGGLGLSGGSQPLTGGTIVARFGVEDLDRNGLYDVALADATGTLASARVDLARLR